MNQCFLQRLLVSLVLCLLIATSGHAGSHGRPAANSQPPSSLKSVRESGDKFIIGETAQIAIAEAELEFLARIDTGARVTSIHALDVEVTGGVANQRENEGKPVRFRVINTKGEERTLESKIVDVASVRNAQGTEHRYVVELTLVWEGFEKAVEVNLRDRSAMTYKLLIGRNWLARDFLVDVDRGTPEE